LQCIYGNPESPCHFCLLYKLVPCVKRLGPKIQQAPPSWPESIATYDVSIPAEDAASLHYLYSSDTKILCGSIKLDVLARMLARIYSPSIRHSGLRNIIIALWISKSGTRTSHSPTPLEQQHVDITFRELSQKLSNPSTIDEGDIFVSYLLAVWYRDVDSAAINVHVQGLFAIIRHLSQNPAFFTSPMAPFWALLRDEVLWLTRKSPDFFQVCQDFRDILGPKTIQQRQKYEQELRATGPFNYPAEKVFHGRNMYTSLHTMMESAKIVSQCQNSAHDPLIESVLVELQVECSLVEQMHHEDFLDTELLPIQSGEYVKDWKEEFVIIERFHDLILLYICRTAIIALKAPSIQQGLCSQEGISATISLISLLRKADAFLLAGIQDGRVFGTGDPIWLGSNRSYESSRKHPHWPCKFLLDSLLRHAPGDPRVAEAVQIMHVLAKDFAIFQEIYLRQYNPAKKANFRRETN
jgi:hypothetical protein